MPSRSMSAVPGLRPTITIYTTRKTTKARNLETCRRQINAVFTFTVAIIIIMTRKGILQNKIGQLTCAKFGLLGVTVVCVIVSGQHFHSDIITKTSVEGQLRTIRHTVSPEFPCVG